MSSSVKWRALAAAPVCRLSDSIHPRHLQAGHVVVDFARASVASGAVPVILFAPTTSLRRRRAAIPSAGGSWRISVDVDLQGRCRLPWASMISSQASRARRAHRRSP